MVVWISLKMMWKNAILYDVTQWHKQSGQTFKCFLMNFWSLEILQHRGNTIPLEEFGKFSWLHHNHDCSLFLPNIF